MASRFKMLWKARFCQRVTNNSTSVLSQMFSSKTLKRIKKQVLQFVREIFRLTTPKLQPTDERPVRGAPEKIVWGRFQPPASGYPPVAGDPERRRKSARRFGRPYGTETGLGDVDPGFPLRDARVHPGLFSSSPSGGRVLVFACRKSGGGFLRCAPERIFIPFAGPAGPWKLRMNGAD